MRESILHVVRFVPVRPKRLGHLVFILAFERVHERLDLCLALFDRAAVTHSGESRVHVVHVVVEIATRRPSLPLRPMKGPWLRRLFRLRTELRICRQTRQRRSQSARRRRGMHNHVGIRVHSLRIGLDTARARLRVEEEDWRRRRYEHRRCDVPTKSR